MATLEKRIESLETAQGKQGLFGSAEMNALMADLWAKSGTTQAEQEARHGGQHAMLKALHADIQTIQHKASHVNN